MLLLLGVLALLVSIAVNFLDITQSTDWLGYDLRPSVLTVLLVAALVFSVHLCLCQCWVFSRLQLHAKELIFAVPPPPPGAFRDPETVEDTWSHTVLPGMEELTFNFNAGCYTPFCGCGPQEGGHYELERSSHAELMSTYYWLNFLSHHQWWHGTFYILVGVLQTWDVLLNCVQPALMHDSLLVRGEPRLPELVHSGWINAWVLFLLGLIQVVNCRSLLRNAVGTATAEKEWLAYDITGTEDTWVSAIDAAETTWRKEHMGHLNLTYAWMCVAASAECTGVVHLARLADGLASQTRDMVEKQSQYRFRFKTMTEWDLKKVGIVTRVLQSLLLTGLNVEFFGVSYRRVPAWVSVVTLACIVLSLFTAAWKTFTALSFIRFADPSDDIDHAHGRGDSIELASVGQHTQANRQPGFRGRVNMGSDRLLQSRKCGIRVLVLLITLVTLSTLFVGLGLTLQLDGCEGASYSLLESARKGAFSCWPRGEALIPYEGMAWNSGQVRLWTSLLGAGAGLGWLGLAYWACALSVAP